VPIGDDLYLILRGHQLAAADRRIVEAFAAQAAVAFRQERLALQAAAVGPLAEVDKMRTALLSAVSHDLRTPLASAKAAVDGLRAGDVAFSDADRDELLATASESLEKLNRLVDNLLDMSRVQAGALGVYPQPISMADVASQALDDLGTTDFDIILHLPDDPRDAYADPALTERILVNLLSNALRYSPPGQPPLITISDHAGYVETRIADHGPGIPAADWDKVFMPFQRFGDRDNDTGVGLGLALSRGLTEAMGGTLSPEATPGGGLTMILRLPATNMADHDAADPVLLERLEQWPPAMSGSTSQMEDPSDGRVS
jgi:two-component system sensor histidine kinase KdpD